MSKPLISKYQRERGELPASVKKSILKKIISLRGFTAAEISTICARKPQTVRCWLSDANVREIPIKCLQDLGSFSGIDIYLEFEECQTYQANHAGFPAAQE